MKTLFISLLFVSVTAFAVAPPPKPPKPPIPEVIWKKLGNIKGVIGAYTPFFIDHSTANKSIISVYSNTLQNGFGTLYLSQGILRAGAGISTLGVWGTVIDPRQVYDQSGSPFIRTTAIVKGKSGRFYALLHVGDGYPSPTGFVPAWATSTDGMHWNYEGKLNIDGESPYVLSSSAALVVQEDKAASLDTANPANNRYLIWEDNYSFADGTKKLALLYSANAKSWHFYRKPNGSVVDVWPTQADGGKFPTVARTPYGYEIIAGDTWPVYKHIHLWSCNGLSWRVIEEQAPTYVNAYYKGTNLYYEASTGLLHAITSGTYESLGYHWSTPAKPHACPL